MGLSGQIAHDERYDRADEFLDVAYQLWEGSWDADAVKADKRARVHADPAAVRRVDHAGKILSCSRLSPGRAFAAAHAGAVPGGLVGRGWPSPRAMPNACSFPARLAGLRKLVSELREAVAREGRDPRDIVLHGHHGRRRANGTGSLGQARRVPALRQSRGWPGALRQLHRHRFFHLRAGRADPLREEQRHRIRRAQPDRRAHRPHGA